MKLLVVPELEFVCPWCGETLKLRGDEPLVHDGQRLELEIAIGAVDIVKWNAYREALAEAIVRSNSGTRVPVVVPEKPEPLLLGGVGQTFSLREKLAEFAHGSWSGWMKYMFEKSLAGSLLPGVGSGSVVLPRWAVERWSRQMNTKYADLPEEEKTSDRLEADGMLAIFKETFFT